MNGYSWIVAGLPGSRPKSPRSVQATLNFPSLNSALQPSSQPSPSPPLLTTTFSILRYTEGQMLKETVIAQLFLCNPKPLLDFN